jgi:hypothetical protein
MLHIVTTTSVPYLFHVPSIVGTPNGIPRWFRYLTQYLHPDLAGLPPKEVPTQGILYIRDQRSADKLCFPLRRFQILWLENNETICFLNLLLGDLVSYCPVSDYEGITEAPGGVDQESWRLLVQHVREKKARTGAGPRTVAVPFAGYPPIQQWADMKPAGGEHLLWEGVARDWPQLLLPEREKWRNMLPVFSTMEDLDEIPFLRLDRITRVRDGKLLSPEKIGDDPHNLRSHGYRLYPKEAYQLRVDQITPRAFYADAPTAKPFSLSIEGSETGIRPSVKTAEIDGPYGFYELSFDLDPTHVGSPSLLHLAAEKLTITLKGEAKEVKLPNIAIPIFIGRRWRAGLFWALLALISVVLFVSAERWMPAVGIGSIGGTIVQALLFGLALLCGNKAGVGDLTRDIGGRV